MRIVTDKHFKNNGTLKPSAFSPTDIKRRGVSLVRGDLIDLGEMTAIAADIVRLHKAKEARGALVGDASALREKADVAGVRALCLIDDPVRNEDNVRDNEAHAITLASNDLEDDDVLELRFWLLRSFGDAKPLQELYAA
jgi:hypothetical protein